MDTIERIHTTYNAFLSLPNNQQNRVMQFGREAVDKLFL